MVHGVEGMRIEAIGERIIQEPVRGAKDLEVAWLFKPQALECAEIVHIAELSPKLIHDLPVTSAGLSSVSSLQPFSKVGANPVVIEKRIVNIEQENGIASRGHFPYPRWRTSWLASGPRSNNLPAMGGLANRL